MPVYGKFNNVLVREVELLDGSGNLNSTEFTLHTFGMLQPSNGSRGASHAITFNYDQTTSNPHYTHWVSLYDNGTGFKAPHGILINKKLKPGEIMTISGYFVRGHNGGGDGTETDQDTSSIQIIYENRPGTYIQSFTREGESSSSDGQANEGKGLVLAPDGTNVGIVTPWEYASGESFGDFFPASNSGGTGYEMTSNLYNRNIHSPTAASGYPRFYRIRIGNDSETEAAIKIIGHKPGGSSESVSSRIGIYKLKVRVEKTPQFLDGARIGIGGDINYREIPTDFVNTVLNGSLANEPGQTYHMFDGHSPYNRYAWMVRSLNSFHMHPGAVVLPLGGTDAYADDLHLHHVHDFESATIDQVYTTGWSTNTDDNTGPLIKSNGSNKLYGFVGAVQAQASVSNPPHAGSGAVAGRGWRWIQLDATYTTPVVVNYRVYEAVDNPDPYGMHNKPESSQLEHMYLQYKVGSGAWVTANTHLAQQDPLTNFNTVQTAAISAGQSSVNPLSLRWIAYTASGSSFDHWGVDDVAVIYEDTASVRTVRPFLVPDDGHLRRVVLKWKNAYTGDIKLQLAKINTLAVESTFKISDAEYDDIYTNTQSVTSAKDMIVDTTSAPLTKGDMVVLVLITDTVSTYQKLGNILGTATLRFDSTSIRVIT